MGIRDFLPHLPVKPATRAGWSSLGLANKRVAIDAGSLLWQCASRCAEDYIRGIYTPSIAILFRQLHFFHFICKWKMTVVFDGRENPHKAPEAARRGTRREIAVATGDARGQIRNDPVYIGMAIAACRWLGINFIVSAEEADAQVVAALCDAIITSDGDVVAFQAAFDANKSVAIVVVSRWLEDKFRVYKLAADVEEGAYPLFDLYLEHGPIIFHLYAACVGCDFTDSASGILHVGISRFLEVTKAIVDGNAAITPQSFAQALLNVAGRTSLVIGYNVPTLVAHFEGVVAAYTTSAKIYDNDGNICRYHGGILSGATSTTIAHMKGTLNPRTGERYTEEEQKSIDGIDFANLLHSSQASTADLRGVSLPPGKALYDLGVSELSDVIICRGGSASQQNKKELQLVADDYLRIDREVPNMQYVNRSPEKEGPGYINIETGRTANVGIILGNLASSARFNKPKYRNIRNLIALAKKCYDENLFEDRYDNIAETAPDLQEELIYKSFGHIGESKKEKNVGDALRRILGSKDISYHAIAKVPESSNYILISKTQASTTKDQKAKKQTADGEKPPPTEYFTILELETTEPDEINDGHSLGRFTKVVHSYCLGCTAGIGDCRHKAQALWCQYHHWTNNRPESLYPSTIGFCKWARRGAKARMTDIQAGIYGIECQQMPITVEEGKEKAERAAKRNCTEGLSSTYQLYEDRHRQQVFSDRFDKKRPAVSNFLESLRKHK